MMKRTTVLIMCILVTFAMVPAANAQFSPPQLDYIDAQLDIFMPRLETFQADYLAGHGYYYQLLFSHDQAPDGYQPPDHIQPIPNDQAESLISIWEFADLPPSINWRWRIDVYDSDVGYGYVVTVETVVDGETWRREINYGPDDWRGNDWTVVLVTDL